MSRHEELFRRLLDDSSALLAAPEGAGIAIPDDELHGEIIVPLLPAMLGDAAIRKHWSEQAATGFVARLARHLAGDEPAPRWMAGDFEIHVTASYTAGPDAKALADTLLSEDSLRDLTVALMNQLLDALWPSIGPVPAAPSEAETAAEPVPQPEPVGMPEPAGILVAEVSPAVSGRELRTGLQPLPEPVVSRALVRALCRKLGDSWVQRGLIASGARDASAAIVARRILQRACRAPSPSGSTSPRRRPRRASL